MITLKEIQEVINLDDWSEYDVDDMISDYVAGDTIVCDEDFKGFEKRAGIVLNGLMDNWSDAIEEQDTYYAMYYVDAIFKAKEKEIAGRLADLMGLTPMQSKFILDAIIHDDFEENKDKSIDGFVRSIKSAIVECDDSSLSCPERDKEYLGKYFKG